MRHALHILLLTALLAGTSATRAEEESSHDRALKALRAGEIAPLPEILAVVAAETPGSVIEVELKRRHGRYVYEVEVLTADGRLIETYVDAADKRILNREDSSNEFGRD